ncbi:hypothetical protein, conserved [Plasmodium vivax]|nr:unnamed protein product [Plasmodium vivax]SCO71337.1 hypothetical protein, conserved [Plasmodium vivax]
MMQLPVEKSSREGDDSGGGSDSNHCCDAADEVRRRVVHTVGSERGKDHADVRGSGPMGPLYPPGGANGQKADDMGKDVKVYVGSRAVETKEEVAEPSRGRNAAEEPSRGTNPGSVFSPGEEDLLLSLLKMKDLVAEQMLRRRSAKWRVDQMKQAKSYLEQKLKESSRGDSTGMLPCASEYNGYSQLLNLGLTFMQVNVVNGVMVHTFKCLEHAECLGEAYVLKGEKLVDSEIFIKGRLCIGKREAMFPRSYCGAQRYRWIFFDDCYSVRSGRNRAIAMGYKYFNSSKSAKRYVRNFICSMKERCASRLRVVNYRGTKSTWIELNSIYHERGCLFYRPWEWGNGSLDRGNGSHSAVRGANKTVLIGSQVTPTNRGVSSRESSPQADLPINDSLLNATCNWGGDEGVVAHLAGQVHHRGAAPRNGVLAMPPSLGLHRGGLPNGKDALEEVPLKRGNHQGGEEALGEHDPSGTTGRHRIDVAVDTAKMLSPSKGNNPEEDPSMCAAASQGEVNPSGGKRASSGAAKERQRSAGVKGREKKMKTAVQGGREEGEAGEGVEAAETVEAVEAVLTNRRGRSNPLKPRTGASPHLAYPAQQSRSGNNAHTHGAATVRRRSACAIAANGLRGEEPPQLSPAQRVRQNGTKRELAGVDATHLFGNRVHHPIDPSNGGKSVCVKTMEVSSQPPQLEKPPPSVRHQPDEVNATHDGDPPNGEQRSKRNYVDAIYRKDVTHQMEVGSLSEGEKSNTPPCSCRVNPEEEEQHTGGSKMESNYSNDDGSEGRGNIIPPDEESLSNGIKEKQGDQLMETLYPNEEEKADESPESDRQCVSPPHLVKCERRYSSEGGIGMGHRSVDSGVGSGVDSSVDSSGDFSILHNESINEVQCDPHEQNSSQANRANSANDGNAQKLGGNSSEAETESGNCSTCCQSEEGEKLQKG